MGCWWGVYTPFETPKLRAIDEPSSSWTDSRKRTIKNVLVQANTVPVACARVPDREFVRDACGRHSTICNMRTVEEFPHICATYINHADNIPENRQHRDHQHPTCRGVSTRMHRQPVPWPPRQLRALRGCQLPSEAADSQSLPYPSRKPPTRGRQYMYDESTIQKAHQPWDSTREVCAFLALPSVQHARARLPKARPFMCLPALDSQKAPGTFILPEPLEPLPSRPAQPSPPPTPSVITLLPASRARRARSHTFRFSS